MCGLYAPCISFTFCYRISLIKPVSRSGQFIKPILTVPMDKVLKCKRLDFEPGSEAAANAFEHYLKTFNDYLEALTTAELQPGN